MKENDFKVAGKETITFEAAPGRLPASESQVSLPVLKN